jgi:molybdenum cofactor biosynthesis enzyme MoaA
MLKRFPRNRLVQHLVDNCVYRYGCPAARNFVMERWECPVPTSPTCNADCVGCISKQPEASGVCASQERLSFVPTVEEIIEFTVLHLETAPRAVISFGQGCEGEPLLVGDIIEQAIRAIRKRTTQGIINLNTNASRPDVVERLCQAGLDSIRVSLNSAQRSLYTTYYNPRNYTFDDVLESMRIVRKFDCWISINYLVFPGLTDHPEEVAALETIVEETGINMIQARNMNIDPDWYIDILSLYDLSADAMGVRAWIAHIRQRFPWIKFGYFNPPREEMKHEHYPG